MTKGAASARDVSYGDYIGKIFVNKKNYISLQSQRGIRRRDDNPYRLGGFEPHSLATAFAVVFYCPPLTPTAVRQY